MKNYRKENKMKNNEVKEGKLMKIDDKILRDVNLGLTKSSNAIDNAISSLTEAKEVLLSKQGELDSFVYEMNETNRTSTVVETAVKILSEIIKPPVLCEVHMSPDDYHYAWTSSAVPNEELTEENGWILFKRSDEIPASMAVKPEILVDEAVLKNKLVELMVVLFSELEKKRQAEANTVNIEDLLCSAGLSKEEIKEVISDEKDTSNG